MKKDIKSALMGLGTGSKVEDLASRARDRVSHNITSSETLP